LLEPDLTFPREGRDGVGAEFDVVVVNQHGRPVVYMSGEMDLASREPIRDALMKAQDLGSGDVIVDLSQITFMDSTGINALVRAHREAPEGRFRVVGASERIRRVFGICGVSSVLLEEGTEHCPGNR
jgi:anti-sigma B factor antagonist